MNPGLAVGAGELNEQLSNQLSAVQEELEHKITHIASLEAENRELRRRVASLEVPPNY